MADFETATVPSSAKVIEPKAKLPVATTAESALGLPFRSVLELSVNLTSPITGKIVRFKVQEGEVVKAGQELVLIEAMKMENSIRTDHDVVIGKIKFNEGETVGIGQVVIEFVQEAKAE